MIFIGITNGENIGILYRKVLQIVPKRLVFGIVLRHFSLVYHVALVKVSWKYNKIIKKRKDEVQSIFVKCKKK